MRILLLTSLLLFTSTIVAQNTLLVRLVDSLSEQPLIFGSVRLMDNQQGGVTDENGYVRIELNGQLSKQKFTLQASYVGYEECELLVTPEMQKNELVMLLSPSLVRLPTVDISAEKSKLNGREIIELALRQVKENYPDETTDWYGHYSEKVWVDDTLAQEVDADFACTYLPYPTRNFVSASFKRYYRNDYNAAYPSKVATGRPLLFGNPLFFKYYTAVDDKVELLNLSWHKAENSEKYRFRTSAGPLALLAQDKVKYEADFLDKKLLKDYVYRKDEVVEMDGKLVYKIHVSPGAYTKMKNIMWNKKVKQAILAGTIYVGLDDYAIHKVDVQFAKDGKIFGYQFNEPWQMFPAVTQIEIWYAPFTDGKLLVDRVRSVQEFYANTSLKWGYTNDLRCLRELNRLPDYQPKENDQRVLFEDVFEANLMDVPMEE